MAGKQRSIAGEEARKLCEAFPAHGTRTLASKLLRDNPALYTSYEQARSLVRMYRGENGRQNQSSIRARVPTTKHEQIPPSDAKPIRPALFTATGRGIVISDFHVPYHDQDAIRIALDHAGEHGLTDFCILNGDLIDCYSLSQWCKDPRKRHFEGELDQVDSLLEVLKERFELIWWKGGNHEARFELYMRIKAPELLHCAEFRLAELLHLKAD